MQNEAESARNESDEERITRIGKDLLAGKIPPEMAAGMAARPTTREVKPAFRHVMEFDWHRSFTFWERIKILFGYALLVMIRVPTLHKPGELGAIIMGETTEFDKPTEMMKDRAKQALREHYGKQLAEIYREEEQNVPK